MHMVGIMALYSSSPPTTWGSQCSLNSKSSSAAIEIEANHHRGSQAQSPKGMQGGLSSLFSTRHSHAHSASEVLETSPVGSLRGGETAMVFEHHHEGRSGAMNIPVSSMKSRERSPASVLQGPISRSGGYGSAHSAWDSPQRCGGGLPPLDPHVERGRRRSSLSGERERWTVSRSVGFEVGVTAADHQSRVFERNNFSSSEPVRVEGFGSSSSSYGNSPLDTLTLPLYTSGKTVGSSQRTAPGILEAREKILRLAEEANGILTKEKPKVDSADELLRDAQGRFRVFHDPVVVKAFRMAEEAHKGQMRRNGESFLSHCVETALILAATGVSSAVVAAGLLHDAIDDSNLSLNLLRGALGDDIANLVVGVSRLSDLSQLARDSNAACDPTEAERLRTMILAMVDVRVVLIKIADRLHNLRTLHALPAVKQSRIATETLEIFAPLVNRLGIWSWKAELEDLCFKCLKPQEHQDLSTKLSERCREKAVMSSVTDLDAALKTSGVHYVDLCGRPKNLYSVYKKMTRKNRTPEEILDVRGLRLIVSDEKSCYEALEIVHQLWRQIPGKSKDYITDSKPNGYKSLHTVVTGSDGYPLEVQIRTVKMHHQAEYGLAAHWRYKEDRSEHTTFSSERVEWARWVLTWHSELTDTKLRVSPLGADLKPPCPLFAHNEGCPYDASCCGPLMREDDPVFVIKVNDEHMLVRELPPGSTVGDLVHTRSSDKDSVAANADQKELRVKVNHQFVDDMELKLRMGDFIEVLTVSQPVSSPKEESPVSSEKPCGRIALEFQREQLKRLYGGTSTETPALERSPSVAGLM